MKKIFYIGMAGLALFEVLNVYFIMPMPGSQQMNSLDVAYFLYTYRWYFRIFSGLMIVTGAANTFQKSKRKWVPVMALLLAIGIVYLFNFQMVADQMFKQPENLTLKPKVGNLMKDSTMVVGVEYNGEAKAYPLRFIVYHHQVRDTVGGKPMMITYCSVCRTGRVFEPVVKGKPENFRLVGMDHFNAMFEDVTTKSWWRQVNGEAVTGPLKGEILPEVESIQVRLDKLFELYPNAKVMQLDQNIKDMYDTLGKFERGKSKGKLTRTDSLSWKEKSWVVGIEIAGESKAYDWIQLKEKRIINDNLSGKSIVLAIAKDDQSFAVFEHESDSVEFIIRNDTLFANNMAFDFSGRDLTMPSVRLKRVKAYQEFWHSWQTFHPTTKQYE
ncbi:MAG: DUF3179 domain-containing (seleno)protein [Bacteroidota bacterium]